MIASQSTIDSEMSKFAEYLRTIAAELFVIGKTESGSLGNNVRVSVRFIFGSSANIKNGLQFIYDPEWPHAYFDQALYYGQAYFEVDNDTRRSFSSSLKKFCKKTKLQLMVQLKTNHFRSQEVLFRKITLITVLK